MDKIIEVDGRQVKITHPDKLLYPADGITKKQVVEYYLSVAKLMLPVLRGRPVTLQRWPEGIEKEGFYQKEASDYFPSWIKTTEVELVKGGKQHLVIVDSAATLAYLANQGVLTFHIWLSKLPKLHRPDRMVFDLDPPPNSFPKVMKAAKLTKKVLEAKGYESSLMTTGSKGLHMIVELDQKRDFEKVRAEAETIAAEIAKREPQDLTTEVRKNKRQGRIYIDVARNGYGQTQVAPYSLRALPKAPLAKPISWQEIKSGLSPQKYNLKNILLP